MGVNSLPGGLINSIVVALAAALLDDGLRARDLLEGDARVVRAAEPVESPVAPSLEGLGEPVACFA